MDKIVVVGKENRTIIKSLNVFDNVMFIVDLDLKIQVFDFKEGNKGGLFFRKD